MSCTALVGTGVVPSGAAGVPGCETCDAVLMAVTLERYRDRANGFELLLPTDWERVDPPADEVRLVAVEPLAGQGFRTNVVVTLDDLPDGLGLEGWQTATT